VLESNSADLPERYRGTVGPLPPLGGVFGVPLFVDEPLLEATRLAFARSVRTTSFHHSERRAREPW